MVRVLLAVAIPAFTAACFPTTAIEECQYMASDDACGVCCDAEGYPDGYHYDNTADTASGEIACRCRYDPDDTGDTGGEG